MILKKIHLKNFRNFEVKDVAIGPFMTVAIGENARGKTNLLEGVYFSLFGYGFRETREEELLLWEKENALVETIWGEKDSTLLFQISMIRKNPPAGGEKIEKKFFVNKTGKSHNAYFENQTKGVLFSPEHIEIMTGSPEKRRSYVSGVISVYDREYIKRVNNYENALRRRNKLLEQHKDVSLLEEELKFWNSYLEEQSVYIVQKREEYCTFLNERKKIDSKTFRIEYLKNEFTKERAADVIHQETQYRRTVIGPQKDDFQIYLTEKGVEENVHRFGSRSEQRLGMFWLKLNEIWLMEEYFKKRPLLLLDDVFSELDLKNKQLVLEMVKNYQTIITTTELELLELATMPKEIIKI